MDEKGEQQKEINEKKRKQKKKYVIPNLLFSGSHFYMYDYCFSITHVNFFSSFRS